MDLIGRICTVVVPAFTGISGYEATHQVQALVSNSENMECVLGTQSCLFLRLRPRFFFKKVEKSICYLYYTQDFITITIKLSKQLILYDLSYLFSLHAYSEYIIKIAQKLLALVVILVK